MSQLIESLNAVADVWSAHALALFIQSSLVIMVLLTLEWALRRHVRAAIRYGLLLLVLVKLILPPGLALPTGAAYWLPAPSATASDLSGQRTMAVTVREVEGSLIPVERADSARSTTGRSALTLPAVFMGVWGWVALALGGVLAHRSRQIRRIVAASTEPPDALRSWFEQYRQLAAGGHRVRLRVSDQVPSPALCGLWRPTIIIPRMLVERLAASDLQAILVHEMKHVERHDLWINHLQTVLQIGYWWHPLLWLANARIRQVREEAVDDAVMVALADRADRYPATLIEVAKAVMNRPFTRLGFLGIFESRSRLSRRVRRLVDGAVPRRATLGWPAVAGLVLAGAVLLPMARAERSADSAPTGPATPSASTEAVVFLDCTLFEVSAEPFRSRYPEAYEVGPHGELIWILYGPDSVSRIFMDFLPGTEARMVSQPRLVVRSGVAGTISMTRAEDILGQAVQLGTECRLTALLQGGELDLTIQATLTEPDSSHPAGYAAHEVANSRVRVRPDEHSAVAMAAVGHQKRFVLVVRPSVVSESGLEQLLAGSDLSAPDTPPPAAHDDASGATLAALPQVMIEAKFVEAPESFASSLSVGTPLPSSDHGDRARSLSTDELRSLIEQLEGTLGTDVLVPPQVTTLSGRQVQIQLVDKPPVAAGQFVPTSPPIQPFSLGPTLDIVAHVASDASTVELVVSATVNVLIDTALPLPIFRTRTLTSRATIPDGHTLLLIEAAPSDHVHDEAASPRGIGTGHPASARRLLLLVTPTVVGPDGVSLEAPR